MKNLNKKGNEKKNQTNKQKTLSTLFIRISIKSRTNIDDLVTWNTWFAINYVFGITQFFFIYLFYLLLLLLLLFLCRSNNLYLRQPSLVF